MFKMPNITEKRTVYMNQYTDKEFIKDDSFVGWLSIHSDRNSCKFEYWRRYTAVSRFNYINDTEAIETEYIYMACVSGFFTKEDANSYDFEELFYIADELTAEEMEAAKTVYREMR